MEGLDDAERNAFMRSLQDAAIAVRSALNPNHMHYECLGISSPRLHWHLVPRYKHDPRWGQPAWEGWPRNEFNLNRFVLADEEHAEIAELVRASLEALKTESRLHSHILYMAVHN